MPGRNFLHIPGPSNVPERVMNAMHVSQEDMRGTDFPSFTLPLFSDLKKIFKTKTGRPFIFPASGTGAWEASISNTLSPGDKVLMSGFGRFSDLWIDMCQRHGLDVEAIDVEWGKGVPVEQYADRLKKDTEKKIKGVFVTHNETATGVTSDVAEVRQAMDAADHPALLFVDGVSSIASIDFQMDTWGVDLAISGSQKGLMLPTGLGIVCASEKALAARKQAKLHRTFFSFDDMMAVNDKGFFPYTPATTLMRGLRESLNMLFEEGLESVFQRHHRMATAVRKAVAAWGLELVAHGPQWYSDTVSAVYVPEGFDSNAVVKRSFCYYNVALSIGLDKVAGKAFRIGHLGDMNEMMVLTPIAAAEMAMKDVGIAVKLGSGVAAAQEYLCSTAEKVRG